MMEMIEADEQSKKRPRPSSPIGVPEDRILRALLRFFYLTAIQIGRTCGLSPRSLTYTQTRVKALVDHGYVQRIFLPRASQRGSAPSVYCLSRKGLNYLRDQGLDISRIRYRPSEQQESLLHLSHTLEVNDFLISCYELERRHPEVEVREMRHERDLKREPFRVEDSQEGKIVVCPDAWVDLRLRQADETVQSCLVLELDRGTEEERKFRHKVRGMVTWSEHGYEQQFGTTSLTLAVVVTAGERNGSRTSFTGPSWSLRRWTRGSRPTCFGSPPWARSSSTRRLFCSRRAGVDHSIITYSHCLRYRAPDHSFPTNGRVPIQRRLWVFPGDSLLLVSRWGPTVRLG